MAKAPMAKRPVRNNSNGSLMLLGMVAMIAAFVLILVSMASLVLLVFGLLPTFVAVLIDRSPQRFAFFSVFAMNFAGIFPYLLDLWMGSNSMSVAIDSLTNVFALFVMYGCAALGWILFIITPPVVTTVMTIIAQRRVTILRARQKKLLAEWGDQVTGEESKEMDPDEADDSAAPAAPST